MSGFTGKRLARRLAHLLVVVLAAAAMLGGMVYTLQAQEEPAPEPATPEATVEPPGAPRIHVVSAGENLSFIGQQYGVAVSAILLVNNLLESDVLFVGQELTIPGGEGEAVPTAYNAQLGDTIPAIAARFNITPAGVLASNRLINLHYVPPVGDQLALVSRTGTEEPVPLTGKPHIVAPGETLLQVAARYGVSPLSVAAANGSDISAPLYVGQRLRIPSAQPYTFLPGSWTTIELKPADIFQGSTVSVYVENLLEGTPTGEFAGQPLRFVPHADGYAALVGIDAFTEPGTYTLEVRRNDPETAQPFQQEIPVFASGFAAQTITVTEELSELLAPNVRQEEDAFLSTIFGNFSEERRWDGLFQTPVTETVVTAGYGGARSYNGGPFDIYHTGVDFAGTIGTPILAPANGIVVYVDTLALRGLTVIIDHGLGVMSSYYHLSEALVEEGEEVTAGQQIGSGGNSGLSTGPHLHWDLRIMDVPVDGMIWTEETFP